MENCQVGVYLTLATRSGTGFLDRRLYLPKSWSEDEQRREKAHIPKSLSFQTKPQLAQEMLEQVWSEGIQSPYVTGDSLYGNSPGLRQSIADIISLIGQDQWISMATTVADTGVIWKDWCALRILLKANDTNEQWLLIRRTQDDDPDYDFFISNAPIETTLTELAAVASMRHEIEQAFEEAKGQLGLADYEVRT